MKLFVLAILLFAGCHWGGKDIALVGDSHIKRGQWDSLGLEANNFGVGNETVAGTIKQVKSLRKHKPKICFIECGANDIALDSSYEQIKRDYVRLVDTIRLICTPVAVKVLYVYGNNPWCDSFNMRVRQLNQFIDSLGIATIDLNEQISANGYRKQEYAASDGLHLNEEGYKVFANSINCWIYRREMDKWYNKILLR